MTLPPLTGWPSFVTFPLTGAVARSSPPPPQPAASIVPMPSRASENHVWRTDAIPFEDRIENLHSEVENSEVENSEVENSEVEKPAPAAVAAGAGFVCTRTH
jgi:hypothetical protein